MERAVAGGLRADAKQHLGGGVDEGNGQLPIHRQERRGDSVEIGQIGHVLCRGEYGCVQQAMIEIADLALYQKRIGDLVDAGAEGR